MLEPHLELEATKMPKFLVKIKISVQVYRCVSTVVIHALFPLG